MQNLSDMFEPVIESMGYELVGVEYVDTEGHSVVRVYIDHENGIKLEDCSKISHQLSALLEVEDPIVQAYDLEVSSPGLERPLFKLQDFERFKGHGVKIKMAVAQLGRKNYRGIINGVTDQNCIEVTVDNELFELPINDIKKANLLVNI